MEQEREESPALTLQEIPDYLVKFSQTGTCLVYNLGSRTIETTLSSSVFSSSSATTTRPG